MCFREDDTEHLDLKELHIFKSFHTDTESRYLNIQDYEIS